MMVRDRVRVRRISSVRPGVELVGLGTGLGLELELGVKEVL